MQWLTPRDLCTPQMLEKGPMCFAVSFVGQSLSPRCLIALSMVDVTVRRERRWTAACATPARELVRSAR